MTDHFDDHEAKFRPFEKTDIKPYIDQMDTAAKAFAGDYDIEKVKTGLGEGFSISVDIQQYIDDAVKNLHKQVASQVESNLQAILKEAFMLTIEPLHLQPIVTEGLWHSFLQKLSLSAEVAAVKIEARQ